jgi:hypothetical protein
MAQTTSSRSAAEGAAQAAEGAAQAAEGAARATAETQSARAQAPVVYDRLQAPIVYERKRSKGKRKYSRNVKDPQKLEVDASRAAHRLARAVADGFSEYRSERNKSARRKRDGAIKDAVRNTGRGLSEAIDTAARAPRDLTQRATTKRLSRLLIVPPPFSYFMRGR